MSYESPPPAEMGTFMLDGKPLGYWLGWMCFTEGYLNLDSPVPDNRYGDTAEEVAYHALAARLVMNEMYGEPDDMEDAVDATMLMAINGDSSIARMIIGFSAKVPAFLLERIKKMGRLFQ